MVGMSRENETARDQVAGGRQHDDHGLLFHRSRPGSNPMDGLDLQPAGYGTTRGVGRAPGPYTAEVGRFRPLLYTVEEAAELLRISRAHLYEYILSGRIRSLKRGRSRRIPPSALEEFVTDLMAEQRDPTAGTWG